METLLAAVTMVQPLAAFKAKLAFSTVHAGQRHIAFAVALFEVHDVRCVRAAALGCFRLALFLSLLFDFESRSLRFLLLPLFVLLFLLSQFLALAAVLTRALKGL